MKKSTLALTLMLMATGVHANSLQDQLAAVDQAQQEQIAAQQAAQRQAEAEAQAEQNRLEKEYKAEQRRRAKIAAAAAAKREAREQAKMAEAKADKRRDQGYEDELRELEIERQRAELATMKAKAKRADDYIDRELKQQDAEADVVQSRADSNRNMSEGSKSLMTSEGKAKEKKASSWFSSSDE